MESSFVCIVKGAVFPKRYTIFKCHVDVIVHSHVVVFNKGDSLENPNFVGCRLWTVPSLSPEDYIVFMAGLCVVAARDWYILCPHSKIGSFSVSLVVNWIKAFAFFEYPDILTELAWSVRDL